MALLPGFIGPSYEVRSVNVDAERCINLYPEITESGTGKNVVALYGTPGLRQDWFIPDGGGRALYTSVATGRVFAVVGHQFLELGVGGGFLLWGTLLSGGGPVSMAENMTQLVLVDGSPNGYCFTFASNTWQAITDAGFQGGDVVTSIDGYFVLNAPRTQQWYISALNDGLSYPILDFASAEGAPDLVVSLFADHRELWVFGTISTEVFFNSGNQDFPFDRIQGAFIRQGCAAPQSPARLDNSLVWLGRDTLGQGMVWRANGYIPQRISTHAVETSLGRYARLDDAVGYSEQRDGHQWYVLGFPTGNATWVYDASTQLWHERADVDNTTGGRKQHRALYHTFGFGQHLVCDATDGRIYTSSLDLYSNGLDPLVSERIAPHIHSEERLLYYSLFELIAEAGIGTSGTAGPGTLPDWMLRWSNDGGHTWGPEQWQSGGLSGAYRQRMLWRRLGRARDRVFHIKIADPVKRALINARIEVN